MSEFDRQIEPAFVKALNSATDASSTWKHFLAALTHDVRDGFFELMKADADLEEALMMAPHDERLHVAGAINAYWRSQSPDVEVPRSLELSAEAASRAEWLAARITYELLKLRGNHRQPTVEDLLRVLR